MELNNDAIIKDDHPAIRTISQPVELPLSKDDAELLQAMYDYVKDSQDDELCKSRNLSPAVGLAAIQVNVPKRMIAVVIPQDDGTTLEWALANPKIVRKSNQLAYLPDGEGCLSVPAFHKGAVCRPARIKVKGYDLLTDQNIAIEAEGYPAMVLQHEIDHLYGVLYYDHIQDEIPQGARPIE